MEKIATNKHNPRACIGDSNDSFDIGVQQLWIILRDGCS